jgi:hypothetical protein
MEKEKAPKEGCNGYGAGGAESASKDNNLFAKDASLEKLREHTERLINSKPEMPEETVGIPQTPDTDNVSDEPPADFNPPDYDPFGDEVAKEAPAPQPSEEKIFSFAEIEAANRRLENSVTGDATEQRPWISARELLENPVTELPFLVEGLFPQVGIAACVGDSDVGKSALLRQLGLSIVTGKSDFVGFKLNTKYKKALYVSTEDGKEAINFLLGKQNSRMQAELADLEGLRFTFIEDFDTAQLPDLLNRMLTEEPADLVVLDGYGDLLNGNPNDFQNVRKFLQPYRVNANRHECLFIFIHHVKKSARNEEPGKNNVNGSQAFEAAMRTVAELREEKENPHIKHLCITKGNYISKAAKTDSFQLCFDEESLTFSNTGERVPFDLLGPPDSQTSRKQQGDIKKYIEPVRSILGVKVMTASELEAALMEKGCIKKEGISPRSAQRIMSRLVNAGVLNTDKNGRETWYSFNDDYDDDSLSS